MGCDYPHDSWDMYWDIVDLITTHFAGNDYAFDLRCWEIADKICRAGDTYRALWLDHMIETHRPPTREWEDELWDSMHGE